VQASAFDELADNYDAAFTDTAVGRVLRAIVWDRLERRLSQSRSVLELGCGTGEDALRLASRGIGVVAIDSSPRMVELAQRKAELRGIEGAQFHCVDMQQLGSALGTQQFDGVLSNFGAINCVPDLSALVAAVASRLVSGAPLVWVVMGRHVPWEWLWYLPRGQWRKAWRRLRPSGANFRGMTIHYPTPAQLCRALRPYFSIERVAPLGIALPPSYAADWLNRSPRALSCLTHLERLAQGASGLASYADHHIVEATRSACIH
jgi:SAM-dependent methyltransferase